jgi:hypothetical protein
MYDYDEGEEDDFFGVMARRSLTNERRVLWVGEIERKETGGDKEHFRRYYFLVFEKLLGYFRKKMMLGSERRLYLVKEPDNEWYLAFRERPFSRAFDDISQKGIYE